MLIYPHIDPVAFSIGPLFEALGRHLIHKKHNFFHPHYVHAFYADLQSKIRMLWNRKTYILTP